MRLYIKMRLASRCDIVVGTPGRVKALVANRSLACAAIRLLVFDEIDKLLDSDFANEVGLYAIQRRGRRSESNDLFAWL